ncbi:uroporphyrinogen III methyltransferase / synthase [Ferrimonas sediminum]|uniref:uroporphyrinogen-III C-methyltransferase n=1 Tax=Ferrimonas sediminum TaxID=718193 RepID=A0A1G8WMI9_9GAMM|nr:uroporphyrinogen-III C-methyltransferase [Ferrimonas sediminum]SDJ79263.1 uroporphyrinogen III methyltransferase / synthase [Ferrimonas sediminum]
MTRPGKVYLVGAGPGDPGLLTQRAVQLMHECDVVCYDLLIDQAVLAMVPASTRMMAVGYRGYCGTSIEYGMHPDVVEQALAGHTVLRLKAGDPLIFGRATEECRCLTHHGIDYEVVPGISSALGAAAYAGFPLTSNGLASDVTFASGHRASSTLSSWAAMGQSSGTLVLYMGAKKLALHAQRLIQEGKAPATPVAVVAAATCASQRVLSTTLERVGGQIESFDNGDPMLVIMGEVVSLADELDWRKRLPLSNVQVLACTLDQTLTTQCKNLGATVVEAPRVDISYGFSDADWQRLQQAESLWLDSSEAALSLIEETRRRQLDCRQWPWLLRGSESACELLKEYNLIAQCCASADSGEVVISALTVPGALCGRRVEVLEPAFPLSPAALALVDELVVARYLHERGLLAPGALVLSQCEHVCRFLTSVGHQCERVNGQQGLPLPLMVEGKRNAA